MLQTLMAYLLSYMYAIALIREILQRRHQPGPAIINRTWYLWILLIFVLTHTASENLLFPAFVFGQQSGMWTPNDLQPSSAPNLNTWNSILKHQALCWLDL